MTIQTVAGHTVASIAKLCAPLGWRLKMTTYTYDTGLFKSGESGDIVDHAGTVVARWEVK
jgi:hypothetical protein